MEEANWLKDLKSGKNYGFPGTHPTYIYEQLDKTRVWFHHTTPEEFVNKYFKIKKETKELNERRNWWVPNPETRARPRLDPTANVQLQVNPFHEGNNLPRAQTTWGWTPVFTHGEHPEYLHLL